MSKRSPVSRPTLSDPRHVLCAQIEAYLAGYMAFPDPLVALVAALWAIGTHTYQVFDAFPYLVITSATKQSGKTRLMELLSFLSHNAITTTDVTPAVVARRMAEDYDIGGLTLMIDEAEKLSRENHPLRALLNVGYRRGQKWMRVSSNRVVEYPVYGPKVFILIGDVFDTLRDRSIVLTLMRGTPSRVFTYGAAQSAGRGLAHRIRELVPFTGDIADLHGVMGGGREAEIWGPLFSLAQTWAPHRMKDLTRIAADLAAAKTAPKRRYHEQGDSEDKARDNEYAIRALRDLSAAIGDARYLTTQQAIDAMRAIPAAPWRQYRGDGLSPILLSDLLSRFDVKPRQFKVSKGKVARGYERTDVHRALATNQLAV